MGAVSIDKWETNNHLAGNVETPPVGMVLIPKGTFKMGSSVGGGATPADVNYDPADVQAYDNQTPQHWVKLTKDFYMGKYQITNAQYVAFLNTKGISNNNDSGYGNVTYDSDGISTDGTNLKFITAHDWGVTCENGTWKAQAGYENHPVINVTWYGAKAYADWIGGSLPTEAQWEYACRAGTTTIYSYGDVVDGEYMWYMDNNGNDGYPSGTKPVGKKTVNPWGLYDMHGNIDEWCLDQWGGGRNYPIANTEDVAIENPLITAGNLRVLRGGSWNGYDLFCRSAYRAGHDPAGANFSFGFRVVFVP